MRRPLTVVALVTAVCVPALASPTVAEGNPTPSAQAGSIGGPKLTGENVIIDTDLNMPPPPTTKATGWLVADLATGDR